MEHLDTDEQDGRAGRQTEARRRYGVQMLAEKCPRMTSVFFFGSGIWTIVVVFVGCLIYILPMSCNVICFFFLVAVDVCFKVLSTLLSLVALWLKHSAARRSAPHESPAPAAQEAPAERAVQRFAGRHPRIASAYLYGYAILCWFTGIPPILLCRELLSVPVTILAFCSLHRKDD